MERKLSKNRLSPEAVLNRLRNWCAYQERSHTETKRKALLSGLTEEEADEALATLISENFLNEQRFATAYAGGKFRIKHWGKNRIRLGLRKHGVSETNINSALNGLQDENYEEELQKLAEKKLSSLSGGDRKKKFYTTMRFLLSKGYEPELAGTILNKLMA
jgi:regulatory protein